MFDIPGKYLRGISLICNDAILRTLCSDLSLHVNKGEINDQVLRMMELLQSCKGLNPTDKVLCDFIDNTSSKSDRFCFLEDWFDDFFAISGSRIFANKYIETYATIISKIHPFFIIGYKLSRGILRQSYSIDDIQSFAENIHTFGYGRGDYVAFYADNHAHLGGGDSFLVNLDDAITTSMLTGQFSQGARDKIREKLPKIPEFQEIGHSIEVDQIIELLQVASSMIEEFCILGDIPQNQINRYSQNFIETFQQGNRYFLMEHDYRISKIGSIMQLNPQGKKNIKELFLLYRDYWLKGQYNQAYFVFFILLFVVAEEGEELGHIVYIYLLSTNILYNHTTMSGGKGLADFLEIFRSVMRKVNKGNYRDRDFASVSNMILAGTTHLELKMGIDKVKKDGIHRAIRDIERAFLQEEKTNPRTKNGMLHFPTSIHSEELQGFRENVRNPHNTDRQYQFSLHFSRKSNGKYTNKTGFRYEKERKDIWKDIELLRKFYTSHHISHCPLPEIYKGPTKESEFIHLLSKEYINIADLIASIDAAGAEIYSPPEIFAHQIRYTRDEESYFKKGCARNEIIPINRPKRLAISYHAGEDFGHILTGMRRIDECVRFMDFGVGDRIGHALAMGICPKKWMEENPRITLSQEEYFDNLVWLYGILQEIIPHYREALAHAQYIKTILENCSFGPSWICNPLSKAGLRTWSTFFRAWELRRYCPTRTIQDSSFSFLSYSEQEKIRKIRQEEKEAWEIYCEYSSTLPYSLNNEYTFPPVSLQYQKGESFGYEKSNEYHEIGRLEIEAYSIVQDYLLGQYSDRGIVFETNPSSNKVIGGLGKYENHPIFRWFPPQEELLLNGAKYNPFGLRKGRMQVCINTDDPGIFPTTIQNEHTLLCRAAQKITNNHYIANKWIDEIREIGVRAFLVNRGHRGAL